MNGIDLTLFVLVIALVVSAIARRVPAPEPVVIATLGVAVGLGWHLVALPAIRLPADRILFMFLPPLLATAAHALPLGAFRRNLRAIGLLAVGLVMTTMGVTAWVAHAWLGFSWASAFLLGAIVS